MMTIETLESRLREAITSIETLPQVRRAELLAMVEETRQRHLQVATNVTAARDALDNWRLLQKYRLFDAEARAREEQVRRNRAAGADWGGDEAEPGV